MKISLNPQNTSPFPHYWETCVGSCHGYTALRADYQRQLKKVHEELGMKYVRFHGLLDDDMCVCMRKQDFQGHDLGLVYNFINIDRIFDFLLGIGMKPFIELGFMPSALASGSETFGWYKGNITPPADYQAWGELISRLARHLLERYGEREVSQWFFEVWNEPNLRSFFTGTQSDYFHLYEVTARALKAVNRDIRVGGPATSCNSWIPEFIRFCEEGNVPLDFITTHHYPTDDPLWKSGMDIEDFFKDLAANGEMGAAFRYERGILRKMAAKTRENAGKYPLYYTEWNTSAMTGDRFHDECFGAAMVAKVLTDNAGLVDGYSYWTFTDIFEENSQIPGVFHGGFGMQTCDGIPKPVYRTFELFHGMGDERVEVKTTDPQGYVEALATATDYGYRIILHNHNIPNEEMFPVEVEVDLSGLDVQDTALIRRIDENHANPKAVWQALGSPEYCTPAQAEFLQKASEVPVEVVKAENTLKLTVPEYGVAAVDLFRK